MFEAPSFDFSLISILEMAMTRPHSAFTAAFNYDDDDDDDDFGGGSFNDTASTDGYKSVHRPQEAIRCLSVPLSLQHPPTPCPRPHLQPRSQPLPPSYLYLMNTGRASYSYSLRQLGIPHNLTPSTQTSPFWHQFDLVDHCFSSPHQQPAFGCTHYNYLSDPFNTTAMSQDFVPVFIGSNTANGKILKGDQPTQRKYRGIDLFKPHGYAMFAVGGEVVDDIHLQDLIRFSKTVGAAFSKTSEEKAENEAKLGFEVKILRAAAGHSRTVDLVNSHAQVWTTASGWAFAEVLNWMQAVRALPRSADLPQLMPVGMEDYALHDLVALYAATVTLDIRPRAVTSDLRARIIRTLAYLPSTAKDWQFIHERLPVGDGVLRKLVETFFVHGERNHYRQRGEVGRIQRYVNGCGHAEFKDMVVSIMQSRNEGRLAAEGLAGANDGKRKGKGKERVDMGKTSGAEEVGQAEGKTKNAGEGEKAEAESVTPKDSVVGSPAGKAAKV